MREVWRLKRGSLKVGASRRIAENSELNQQFKTDSMPRHKDALLPETVTFRLLAFQQSFNSRFTIPTRLPTNHHVKALIALGWRTLCKSEKQIIKSLPFSNSNSG